MEGQTISLNYFSESRTSCDSVSILVVDDDITCLSIVAAMLKKFNYEVVTVKHPNDALCTLRIKGDAFNLVVSDVHMPDMNGFELKEAIALEFNLPVVLMSADNKEGVVSKGLESGAAFFISKPVSQDDLRDLWQFAAVKKKRQVGIEEAGKEITSANQNSSDEMFLSASTANEGRHNKKDSKRKSPSKEGSDERRGDNTTQSASKKKQKVIWTNALHNRFLEAIRSIGLERSVPKKILEVMNVPGLTRENVASHLQKYRIFLRRVSDASYKIHYADDKVLSRRFVSGSASSGTSHFDRLTKPHDYENPKNFPATDSAAFPNQEASSSSLIDQSGLQKYQFISITGSFLQPNIAHPTLIQQNGRENDRPSVKLAQDNYHTSLLFRGHLSNASLKGHAHSFDSSILGSTRINPSIIPEVLSQAGTSDIISSLTSTNFEHQMNKTNYVGYKISNIKHLTESYREYEGLSSCFGTINLHHNEFQNNSVDAAALPSDNILNLDQPAWFGGASSCYNTDGRELSDVISDYQNVLQPSNLTLLENLESEGLIHEAAFSPVYDLSAFDIMATQQPFGEGDFYNYFSDQVMKTQNQAQQNEGENTASSSFCVGTSNWDNHFSSYHHQAPNQQVQNLTKSLEFGCTSSQFNKTLGSPNKRDDDDYLESLLAFGSFGEKQIQTLEGI